ncbi:hypothetical protein HYPSUDRAFT_465374 [Hypholoma sublateritium FD-334 SS-4]|uniref:Uncharacterized protein n=1 Tax=Hypholoma sublateritium (strain FD-334 SS-4) TaxID=945553 RepID=A0A0D2MLP4_HYPSF|nr:hypothetical protein HYPSUDRAFT_465374 [Hypholoma sublateritium FD-334 SS-4]
MFLADGGVCSGKVQALQSISYCTAGLRQFDGRLSAHSCWSGTLSGSKWERHRRKPRDTLRSLHSRACGSPSYRTRALGTTRLPYLHAFTRRHHHRPHAALSFPPHATGPSQITRGAQKFHACINVRLALIYVS